MSPWKDSWDFISRRFTYVCLISLFYVLPIQLFYQVGISILSLSFSQKWGVISGMSLFLACTVISQIPFIMLVKQEIEAGEISSLYLVRTILDRSWPSIFIILCFLIMVSLGLMLYVLPGIIIFVVLLLLPYSLLWERGSWKQRLKLAWDLGFQHLGKLIILFTLLWVALYLAESGALNIIHLYSAGEPVTILIPSLLGSLILPLYSIYLTYRYMEWREA